MFCHHLKLIYSHFSYITIVIKGNLLGLFYFSTKALIVEKNFNKNFIHILSIHNVCLRANCVYVDQCLMVTQFRYEAAVFLRQQSNYYTNTHIIMRRYSIHLFYNLETNNNKIQKFKLTYRQTNKQTSEKKIQIFD
mgnify:CR=1 FL=1